MKIKRDIFLFVVTFFQIFLVIYHSQNVSGQCWSGQTQKGKRCTDVFKSVVKSSRKICLALCLQTIGCCSVNFNKNKSLCEMCTSKENQNLVEDSQYSYSGNVDIMTNCGALSTTVQSLCVPCMGPYPSVYKATASIDLSTGYPVIRYTCTGGYVTDGGTNTSTCDVMTKEWSKPSTKCKVPCMTSPPNVQNTDTTLDTSADDDVYRYSCSSGYISNGGSAVSMCDFSSKQWSRPSISCIVCFENKYTFNKPISTTHGYGQCRRWDDPRSDFAGFKSSYFEADGYSKTKASNYCRHPRLEGSDAYYHSAPSPYCDGTEPGIEKILCAIPNCGSADIQTCGTPPTISTAQTIRSFPVAGDVFLATFKCLTYSGSSSTPYCPVSRCIGTNSWTTPSISCSENDCVSGGDFKSYNGKRFCTESGRVCQSWTSQKPHSHSLYVDASAKNYCRAIKDQKPWCYTTDKDLRWEYCAVPDC